MFNQTFVYPGSHFKNEYFKSYQNYLQLFHKICYLHIYLKAIFVLPVIVTVTGILQYKCQTMIY